MEGMRCTVCAVLLALATLDPAIGCGGAAAARAAGVPAVRVALAMTPSGPIGVSALAAARREAGALWAPAGVEIVAAPAPAGRTLTVIWTGLPHTGPRADALGAVMFTAGRPAPEIAVSDTTVLAAAAVGAAPWPATSDTIGRVLGRVLAHEIGHYLRGSPGHASFGLMRAQHTAVEFAARNRRPFELEDWNWSSGPSS
jgi:hypothetical protein